MIMTKNRVDISFIVPVFNTPIDVIQRCIDSITSIDKVKYEIIIIDDGSSREIAEYCDVVTRDHKGRKCIHQNNIGVSSARNKGIANAEGEYIYFVDSDDVILPEIFQKVLNYEQQLIFTDVLVKMADFSERWDAFPGVSRDITIEDVLQKITKDGKINGPVAKFIKSDFIRKYNIAFRENMVLGEDAVFLMDMIMCNPSMYYDKRDSYCYFKELETGINRLLDKTRDVISNNVVMYHSMLELIQKYFEEGSSKSKSLSLAASERFVKQIFNNAAELSQLHSFTKDNQLLIKEALDHIDISYLSEFCLLIKMREIIIRKQWWGMLRIITGMRNVYLRLKYKNT